MKFLLWAVVVTFLIVCVFAAGIELGQPQITNPTTNPTTCP